MRLSLRRAVVAAALLVAAPALAGDRGPYEVKSGMYETSLMGVKDVVYFDDFGRKQAKYSTIAFGGGPETHKLALSLADGTTYDIDLDARTGTKMRIPPETAKAIAAAMAPGIVAGAEVKPLPTRTFLGRACKGMEAAAMGMTTRTWTWKGIPLHSEVAGAGGGQPMVVDVRKLTEGPVSAEKFQVPAGVRIQDLSAGEVLPR